MRVVTALLILSLLAAAPMMALAVRLAQFLVTVTGGLVLKWDAGVCWVSYEELASLVVDCYTTAGVPYRWP